MKKSLIFVTAVLSATIIMAPRPASAHGFLEKPVAAPQFTARTLTGDEVRLSQYRGKPVLLMLWATWCPSCRESMPAINALHERFKGRGLVSLAVSNEPVDTVSAYAQAKRLTIPMVSPGAGLEKYQTGSVPSFMLIDTKGQLVYVDKGFYSDTPDQLSALIEEQLQPKTPINAAPALDTSASGAPASGSAPAIAQQMMVRQIAAERALAAQYRRSADAQRRNKLPKGAKHNGIFVIEDDGSLTPVR